MKTVCLGFLVCILSAELSRTSAYLPKYNKNSRRNSVYDSEQKLINALRSAKRTDWDIELCGRYDDWCEQGSENPVLVCCSGYRCKCSLWNSSCRCRTSIFSGR